MYEFSISGKFSENILKKLKLKFSDFLITRIPFRNKVTKLKNLI